MTISTSTDMPRAWEDQAGWEAYYADQLGAEKYREWDLGIFDRALPDIVKRLESSTTRRIWIAGCGITPLGKLLALCGLNVTATDISPSAIHFQNAINDQHVAKRYRHLLDNHQHPNGTFTARVHDFTQALDPDAFDIVINQRALQGFAPPQLQQIADAHAASTRPGGWAIFEFMNVQGPRTTLIEETLANADFLVPLLETNRWHRQALDATGIPYAFVLGMPCVPQSDKLTEPQRAAAQEKLRSFRNEYNTRAKDEYERLKPRYEDPTTKLAILSYCTG